MAGESDFIQWLKTQQTPSARVPVPAGDDLAILQWPGDSQLSSGSPLLVGIDQVLDGVHFDSRKHSPRDIGRKVMNRNLSDCAAMACLPAAAVISVALPRTASLDYAKQLYLGIREAGDAFDCPIVGGDTGSWDHPLALTVTILGKVGATPPVTRSGGRAGDYIFVTGSLGGSILGRHMTFIPRITLAQELASTGKITAMIDISDGLSRDLHTLCTASGVGAIVQAVQIPIHADAVTLSSQDDLSPLDHALNDGEDHELLLSAAIDTLPGCTCIGRLTADPAIYIASGDGQIRPLPPRGFEHVIG